MTSLSHPSFRPLALRLFCGLGWVLPMACALADEVPGLQATFSGVATFGTAIRTEDPNPAVLGQYAAERVPGTPVGQLAPRSSAGGSDLNFAAGRPVSTVLKAMVGLDLRQQQTGVFMRANAWHDMTLKNRAMDYGNYPNGFTQHVPLSDQGFAAEAQFANLQAMDVYGYTSLDVGAASPMSLKLGRQYLNWGNTRFFSGGLNVVNPNNFAGATRPGATAEESRLPLGMLYGQLPVSPQSAVDAFVQYESRTSALPGCGTFYAVANYGATGCNFVNASLANDPNALSSGKYIHRVSDTLAPTAGQFGASWQWAPDDGTASMRLYAARYHSRMPSVRVYNPTDGSLLAVSDNPTPLLPGRLSGPGRSNYALVYPEAIKLLGASFEAKSGPNTQLYGELAYRPNQPLSLNATDMLTAFLLRPTVSVLNMNKDVYSIPAGGLFDGYDRFKVTTANLGSVQVLPNLWGTQRLTVAAELGLSHVAGLPSLDTLRYGRSDDFGGAAYAGGGTCIDNSLAKKACAQDGFVTSMSWGYRMQISAAFAQALWGAMWTPMVYLAHDVSGYSYDGTFVEGRKVVRPGVRAQWREGYFAEMHYYRTWGGAYNTQIDRDTLTLFAGLRF